MKRAVVLVFILVTAMVPLAAGAVGNLQELKQNYNQRASEIPGVVGFLIGHQKINIYVNASQGGQTQQEVLAMELDGTNMTQIQREPFQNQTVDVWTNMEALRSVLQAQDQRKEIKRQMEQGNIDYQVYGFINKLKLAIVKLLI
ncbi:MAG: hypothetical protein SV186_01405 [Candidatus Nanohaloarchaea archaeon]|nr:hypothetical protein [Candidatus Nanohaloarchaea archaeon]